tara:strand:+ start:487 stop:711 length:225 start_codon:yes stop_codon:yes gene_type:complete
MFNMPSGAVNDPNAPFNDDGVYSNEDYTTYTITVEVELNTLEYDAEIYIPSLLKEKLVDEELGESIITIRMEKK